MAGLFTLLLANGPVRAAAQGDFESLVVLLWWQCSVEQAFGTYYKPPMNCNI